jgi:signal transduction histidine kinase
VLLGRLRIRAKLALLVMIPLIAVGALTVPVVLDRIESASRASDTATSVRVASQVGSLSQDLQRERLLAVGFLLGAVDRSRLVLQMSAVTDRVTDVRFELGDDLPDEVGDAIDDIRALADLRQAVLGKTAPTSTVTERYNTVIDELISSLRLVDGIDTTTDEGRQVVALDALLRADEANSEAAAFLLLLADEPTAVAAARFNTEQTLVSEELERFTSFATPTQVSLYGLVEQAFTDRMGAGFTADPLKEIARFPDAAALFPSLESFIALGNFVEKRIVADVTAAVGARQNRALFTAYSVIGGALLILLLVVLLVVSVARAVARPLTRLTASADRVARLAEEELVRVADDESEAVERVHLEAVDITARDEVGDLARAFERVQETAAQLVERQVASRRNVAEMFGHIGRRTQGLVARQVSMIDGLEKDEQDEKKLSSLYRLDHLSNRLLRNATSLVVLSGADWAQEHVTPLPLADAARLALAKVEDYTRVDVRIPADIVLTPAIIADLVQVMAELMENATSFSPPHTRVSVVAVATGTSVRLTITDHGIGLSPERIAEENARMERRERLDLAPTQVLGLFVVGRLARRHGLRVHLSATSGGGVTATVELPTSVLVAAAAVADHASTSGKLALVGGRGRPAAAGTTVTASPRGDALLRLREIIEDGAPTWNAFAVAPSADRPMTVTDDSASEPTVPISAPAAGPATNGHPVGPTSPSGLRQRVPGANLVSGGTASSAERQPPSALDADAARDLIEQFEFGVHRAHEEPDRPGPERPAPPQPVEPARPVPSPSPVTGSPPLRASSADAPAWPAAAYPVTSDRETTERDLPTLPARDVPALPAAVYAPTEALPVYTPPRPATHTAPTSAGGYQLRPTGTSLNRRVPGATLETSLMPPTADRMPAAFTQIDPDEVRSLVEQFEFGVTEALQHAEPRSDTRS